jgi:hypothetical protein
MNEVPPWLRIARILPATPNSWGEDSSPAGRPAQAATTAADGSDQVDLGPALPDQVGLVALGHPSPSTGGPDECCAEKKAMARRLS